jgi:xanthine dehydrogenase accessory factor
MNAGEAAVRVLAAVAAARAVAEVVVVASSHASVPEGARILLEADEVLGTLGDEEADRRAADLAHSALQTDRAGASVLELEGGRCTVFVQPHHPADSLLIVGAGHIARPLSELGSLLGYRVMVLDDRSEYAVQERFPRAERVMRVDFRDPFAGLVLNRRTRLVLVTRGHRYDFEALRVALRSPDPPGYIGMVGSQRRVRATLEQLVREGISAEQLRAIHAPVGLDIGAETPAEIAVAIAAELVRERRGGNGAPLREKARVLERWVAREPEG